MITFDPIIHSYTIGGQQVPSVTTILRKMGFIDTAWLTDYGRDRGKLVHRIIHWHIEETLDEATIDPVLRGYFDAWKHFVSETGFVSTAAEVPLGSILHRFCGTPDHIGTFALSGEQESVVDCKTGAIAPWTGLQLAAYEILYGKPLKRYALALKDNGKYSLKQFSDRQDRSIFLAALACYQWQKNHGGKG